MKYSDKEMAALIGEVEGIFTEHLAKAEREQEETITKSEEVNSEEEVIETKAEETETIEKSEEPNEEELDYDDEDFNEMDNLYNSMTKNEAEAHYKSVKKALFGEETVEKTEETIEKSEEAVEETKTEEVIAKSEFDAVKEENETLKKSIEGLTEALSTYLKGRAPKQKAITKMEYVKKSEEEVEKEEEKEDFSKLTKSEISKRLTSKLRKGEITKSEDREKINEFYMDNKSIETIKHLL